MLEAAVVPIRDDDDLGSEILPDAVEGSKRRGRIAIALSMRRSRSELSFLMKTVAVGAVLIPLLVWPISAVAQTLRIYHIDVEQGASTLVVAPGGRTLLVDSGKNGHGSRIRNVMSSAGVNQIDRFIATHYHEDHFGGIDDLVNLNVPVLESFDRGDKEFLPAAKRTEATFQGLPRYGR